MPYSWDVFCRVVDNFGDAGVCWRLSRQLAVELGMPVRLWIDDLAPLLALEPRANGHADRQVIGGVEVRQWTADIQVGTPADIVVEAFGCGLPEAYVAAMAGRKPGTLWITLEYLSAESWVTAHHGLASPHPRLPLQRYFFFPGFEPGTGGLLLESDLFLRRDRFGPAQRDAFWTAAGFEPPPAGAAVVSLFAYPGAPAEDLIRAWRQGAEPVVAAIPHTASSASVLSGLGFCEPAPGVRWQDGSLELRVVPFLEQARYDELLWSCDCNFVRGEDSFVRAQWASRPFVWQAYPQPEQAHWRKLDAFMDLYCRDLPLETAGRVRAFWCGWNRAGAGGVMTRECWEAFRSTWPALNAHTRRWSGQLATLGGLAQQLARFCQDKLK